MISSSEFSQQLLQQHSSKQAHLQQETLSKQRASEIDRTEFPFRSTSDSNFGDRKPNRQDPIRSTSSCNMQQNQSFISDSKGFKGKATMTTGHEAWDQPGTGPSSISADHVYQNNMHQADISAQLKIATMQSMLDKKLGPELIAKRSGAGGSKLTYIEGWKAIDLANKVFGFNGWSTEIVRLVTDYCEQDANSKKWKAGATCICRITLRDGTFHEDVGNGLASGMPDQGTILQKVMKEAVTDATKRCLRQFGNLLGNCLYDKGYLAQLSKMKPEPYPSVDPSNLVRHGSPTKSPPNDSKSMAPPPARPQQQQPQQQNQNHQSRQQQQQQNSSSSSNQPRQNTMSRSSTSPANVNHSSNNHSRQQSRSTSSSVDPNLHVKPPLSILKTSASSTTSSSHGGLTVSPPRSQTANMDAMLNDDSMFEGIEDEDVMMEGDVDQDDEFFDGIDPEIVLAHEEAAADLEAKRESVVINGSGGRSSGGEKQMGVENNVTSKRRGGDLNGDDSGIAMSPIANDSRSGINPTTSPSASEDPGTPAQSDNSVTPKLEHLEQVQAQSVQSKPQQLPPQQPNRNANASKGRFAKPGVGAGALQSGAMSLSKAQNPNLSGPSNVLGGAVNNNSTRSNNNSISSSSNRDTSAPAPAPPLGRRSQTTSASNSTSNSNFGSGKGGYEAVGSGFSAASSVARDGPTPPTAGGMEQRARSSVNGDGGVTFNNSVQGRNMSHGHISSSAASDLGSNPRKRGLEGSEKGMDRSSHLGRNPLDVLPTDADGSVKRRKD